MKYTYFVSYWATDLMGNNNFANVDVMSDTIIDRIGMIERFENEISKKFEYKKVVISNYILMRTEE